MTAQAQPQLARLRRQAHAKTVTVMSRLIGRPTPWRDWASIADQLKSMGFLDVDDPD